LLKGTDEAAAAGDLLAAFSERDNEVLQSVTARQLFTFLDNEVLLLLLFVVDVC
jgi:hypothetical protein